MASGKSVGWWWSSGVIFQLEDQAILWEWQPCWVSIQGSAPCKVKGAPHGMAPLVLGSQAEASLVMAMMLIPRIQRMGSCYILRLHCAEVGHPCGFVLKGKGGVGEQRQLRHFSVWKETQQTEWEGSVFLHVSEHFSLWLYWGLDEEAPVCSGEAPQDKGCSSLTLRPATGFSTERVRLATQALGLGLGVGICVCVYIYIHNVYIVFSR